MAKSRSLNADKSYFSKSKFFSQLPEFNTKIPPSAISNKPKNSLQKMSHKRWLADVEKKRSIFLKKKVGQQKRRGPVTPKLVVV